MMHKKTLTLTNSIMPNAGICNVDQFSHMDPVVVVSAAGARHSINSFFYKLISFLPLSKCAPLFKSIQKSTLSTFS